MVVRMPEEWFMEGVGFLGAWRRQTPRQAAMGLLSLGKRICGKMGIDNS